MDRFTAALISKYTLKIPPKDDWFAPLVGNWDIRCVDAMRWETKGEWFFRRVLDGIGIEDLLICPAMNPECTVTLRLYRADEGRYDAVCSGENGMYRPPLHKREWQDYRRKSGHSQCDTVEQDHDIFMMLHETFCTLNDHLRYSLMMFR